jgi:hypothetical protein
MPGARFTGGSSLPKKFDTLKYSASNVKDRPNTVGGAYGSLTSTPLKGGRGNINNLRATSTLTADL